MLFALGHGIKGVDHLVLLSVGQPQTAGTAGTAEPAGFNRMFKLRNYMPNPLGFN